MFPRIAILAVLTISAAIAQSAADRSVIVISLDAFPAFALEDPRLPIPTLRKLASEGASALRMVPVNPTVTWPNHTTMVTGVLPPRHGLLVNGAIVQQPGGPPMVDAKMSKEEMVHAPTVYDAAHQAGLTTAQIDWVAINDAPSITWAFPEIATASDPLVKEMIYKGALRAEDVAEKPARSILWRDQIWTKAATYLIREHKPNLLLFHLLTLDTTQHQYGPKTLAATDAMAFLDSCVAQIVDAVKQSGRADRTTIIVVSDHGFKAVTHQIVTGAVLRSANLADKVYGIPEGGSLMLFAKKAHDPQTIADLRKAFQDLEGIERIATRSDFAALGLPDPESDPQMADLMVYAKSGYSFANGKSDQPITIAPSVTGSHGYLASDPDMHAIFIASGYGIKPGLVIDQFPNTRIAPTLARLLGVTLDLKPGMKPGQTQPTALTEILSQP
jgi:predicted AlkP superfamily pyrophosphatase or phosphodiesterase